MQVLLITGESSILKFMVMSATQLMFLITVIRNLLKNLQACIGIDSALQKTNSRANFTVARNIKVHIRLFFLAEHNLPFCGSAIR